MMFETGGCVSTTRPWGGDFFIFSFVSPFLFLFFSFIYSGAVTRQVVLC